MPEVPFIDDKLILFGNVNIVPGHYNDWQAAYDKLAEHVSVNEPNTITYHFGIPLEYAADHSKTDYMFAFEVYGSRDDLYETHLKSEAMTKHFFAAAMPVMTTGLDLVHFGVAGGFLDYSRNKTECGIMQDIQIRATDAAAREQVLGALKVVCKLVLAAQSDGKGEVLTYLGLKSQDNDTGVRIYARYKDRATMDAWQSSTVIKAFWETAKPSVADMTSRAYVPNGKGWLWK